jgi:hypothetical protein
MADDSKRLDESLSIHSLQKSLTGKVNVRPALDRIKVSDTGHVQPATSTPAAPTQPAPANTGSSGGSSTNDR